MDEVEEDDESLHVVYYQALELAEAIMEYYDCKINTKLILLSCVIGTIVDHKQFMCWTQNSH